jgi:hypothetical protein
MIWMMCMNKKMISVEMMTFLSFIGGGSATSVEEEANNGSAT